MKAVIFDMDGVLLDSMPYHAQAWQEVFEPLGVFVSAHEVYAREGENWRKSTRDFLRVGKYTPTPALVTKVFKKRGVIFKDIFKPKVFPGARGLLTMLKRKDLELALVTATPKADVYSMLPKSMLRLFDVLVCGGDTKRGKPYPDPYIKALKRLKIPPRDIVVVENAPYGIQSCKAAGLKCIAVATSLPKKYLTQADKVFDSLREVRQYFC